MTRLCDKEIIHAKEKVARDKGRDYTRHHQSIVTLFQYGSPDHAGDNSIIFKDK